MMCGMAEQESVSKSRSLQKRGGVQLSCSTALGSLSGPFSCFGSISAMNKAPSSGQTSSWWVDRWIHSDPQPPHHWAVDRGEDGTEAMRRTRAAVASWWSPSCGSCRSSRSRSGSSVPPAARAAVERASRLGVCFGHTAAAEGLGH